jgi:uncharacterized Rmd1/YagE family protein
VLSYPLAKTAKTNFRARALLVGERLDLRSMEGVERWASDPVTLSAGAYGVAILFRYGAIVLFDVAPLEEAEFLRQLRPFIQQPYPQPEMESLNLTIQPDANEGMEGNTVRLTDHAIERIQLVADILSKSTVLARYETQVRQSFERIEPLAVDLERASRSQRHAQALLRYIGTALLSEHNMVGQVEVMDKPELLWEHPELERLYLRLEDEFEIHERHAALQRKFELVSRTAQTALEILRDRRNLRVEWYIVILIVVEILLTLYQLLFAHGK